MRFAWIALLVGAASSLGAQADSARPFVAGGVYDKPYLGNLMGRTAIGGYAEAHARYQRVEGVSEDSGFELKRFNLFTATQVSDFVRIGAELEIEEGGEEITLEYAAIDVGITPAFYLRAGMILSPLGRFNLSHDSPRNPVTDRPIVSTDLIGVALSEPGIGAFGVIPIGGGSRITYEVYATNGYNSLVTDAAGARTSIPEGKKNFEDENQSPALVSRLSYSPSNSVELGLSGHRGAYNVFRLDGAQVAERRNLTLLAADIDLSLAGFQISGEGVIADIELPSGLVGAFAGSQRGFYLDVVRDLAVNVAPHMPGSRLSAVVRADVVDFDTDIEGDATRRLTLGLNFSPTSDTVLKFNYFRQSDFDRFNNAERSAGLLFSAATYF